MNVCILGRGKVGRCLHAALREGGHPSLLARGTSTPKRPSRGPFVFVLAVPDAQLRSVAQRLLPILVARDVVLHCSGNRGPDELGACRERGAHVATMHPMVSFASARRGPPLVNTTWVARGDRRALVRARELARAVGARCVEGPSGAPAYHAAAATLGNGSVALAALSVRMLGCIGLDARTAERACAGMLRSVAHNLEHVGLPGALTGPIARGDADTVQSHVLALRALDPELAAGYIALAPLIVACAIDAGLSAEDAARIQTALRSKETRATSRGKRARTRRQ